MSVMVSLGTNILFKDRVQLFTCLCLCYPGTNTKKAPRVRRAHSLSWANIQCI